MPVLPSPANARAESLFIPSFPLRRFKKVPFILCWDRAQHVVSRPRTF